MARGKAVAIELSKTERAALACTRTLQIHGLQRTSESGH